MAAIASLPSYYNALIGPFVLSADKLRDAQELSDLGWERHLLAFGGLLGVWLLRSFGKASLALKEA